MPDRDYDVVVIGAGPAGLAAACRAAECGRRVALLDDNPHPGGQIWRNLSGKPPKQAARWLAAAERHAVELIPGARVFDVPEPGRIAVEMFDAECRLGYRCLILATGARERFLPFPGWTLPNVVGAGGLQALAKSGLPVAGKRVVIAGSGPLLLAVARYLRTHGADVRLVAEQAPPSALLRFGLQLALRPAKLLQALALFGTRYLTSCWPVSAQGNERLESVTLRRAAHTWTEPCDYLACGFGLIPNLELAELLGCRTGEGGVHVDDYQMTSVESVYCAGEATGIGGLEPSIVEGEIAGYAAAGNLRRAQLRFPARQPHRRFAAALDTAFALRDELRRLPRPGTLVCRCEDVTIERVRACATWREARLHTRCGMGPCQGRVCGGAVEFLLGWQTESVRPPVFPARIGSIAPAPGPAGHVSDRKRPVSR